ncbi:MAG TPA: hypothetical protein ENN80_10770 [Candidatus Hydrogenedentes bacterium]|nr:hypothetical protein [Candidatus Hydrogenedentota bacterium]
MSEVLESLHRQFRDGLHALDGGAGRFEHRIGAELKFPLVNLGGTAANREMTEVFWHYLAEQGWELVIDSFSGNPAGARTPGERNDHVASCETGYCKIEFSLAHAADLFSLQRSIDMLPDLIAPFAERHTVRFLGLGIHPVTPPSAALLAKQGRASFWDRVFPSNTVLTPEEGDDYLLFTVNTASHVHVSIAPEAAVRAVNVMNGFSGPIIALTANSSVWRGDVSDYMCTAEKLWDWWAPAEGRVGVPKRPFESTEDYVEAIAKLGPVYVNRDGHPITLRRYPTFLDYFGAEKAIGEDAEGNPVEVVPEPGDIETHNSCCWYNARISRYYTVESRVCDQQPQEALIVPAALALGLAFALDEGQEELDAYSWDDLRAARDAACKEGLEGESSMSMMVFAQRLLNIVETGLKRRGRGEEQLLEPLWQRLQQRTCPADDAAAIVRERGIEALVAERSMEPK